MSEADFESTLRVWRRHLHANPEFGFTENETAKFVAARLAEFGITEIETGIGGTGVVASIQLGDSDRVIALRADMDCLQIQETTDLPYASKSPGLMHACGHDGHTTMLLGAAARLAREGGFDGTVRFIFQPAEEWGQGMTAMISDGLGSRIPFDEIYGLHNKPGLSVGAFETRSGAMMGAEDGFVITVRGAGGHASRPQDCRDAIVCASAIVGELQTIVSRNVDPAQLAVVSVTSITGDNVVNAISSMAEIKGDCRHFDTAVSQQIEASMKRIVAGIAAAHGCDADVTYDRVFIPLVNHVGTTAHAVEVATALFGAEATNPNAEKMGASEDFARALDHAPGTFAFIGNGDSAPLHNAAFDFNDAALMHGVNWFVNLVRHRLPLA
ncbi:MAG: M20 aminoacylase family protein [Pseudomonadota bacterium]